MRPLPPTLRENRRYVLIQITSEDILTQKEIYKAIAESVSDLYGDVGAAKVHPAVVWSEGSLAVVRCARGFETELIAAIACILQISGKPVLFSTIKTSGTIHGVRKGFSN